MGAYNVKEWFNISEIANIIGCSRPTIYKKIDTLDTELLHSLQKRVKNITYYHYKLIELIEASFNEEEIPVKDNSKDEVAVTKIIESVDYKDEYIQELKSQIDFLKEQLTGMKEELRIKDEFISKYSNLLEHQQKLVENEQILRREEPKIVLQLEETNRHGLLDKIKRLFK